MDLCVPRYVLEPAEVVRRYRHGVRVLVLLVLISIVRLITKAY
jgi:hypothetical protein